MTNARGQLPADTTETLPPPSDPASRQNPASRQKSSPELVRALELELAKIRSQASAARLEARAAELELMIQQLRGGRKLPEFVPRAKDPSAAANNLARLSKPAPTDKPAAKTKPAAKNEPKKTRQAASGNQTPSPLPSGLQQHPKSPSRKHRDNQQRPHRAATPPVASKAEASHQPHRPSRKRRKPTPWLASALVHLLLLILLAGWTLTAPPVRDQVALAASTAEAISEPMETFTIETDEPPIEEPEEATVEPALESADVAEIEVSPVLSGTLAPPPPPAALFQPGGGPSANLAKLEPSPTDAESSTAFCGVEGGGNHFVYLVDSSGSMGSAFPSARAELLRSIAQLRPDQRFYVIFFDESPDYMRLADPQQDEPQSVLATPENKQRLQQWAMGISMNSGRAPYEPLQFALELRPDVIFLLSDGEFPQRIEDQLRRENRYENLFGDSGPICTVHTIGYHSREGEERMRRIAEQNGGQYRHVPKP